MEGFAKKLRRVDQVSRGAGRIALINARGPDLPAPLDRHVFNNRIAENTAVDLLVERKNYTGVNVVFAKRFGQGAGDVGQSAGLGEGHNFR